MISTVDEAVTCGLSTGDEVVTCGLSMRAPNAWGVHRHDDPCFEVRQVIERREGYVYLTDLLLPNGSVCVKEITIRVAPVPLLRRKTAAFEALAKLLRSVEYQCDQGSAHAVLDRILCDVVDRYLFCEEGARRQSGPPEATNPQARIAFDKAARLAIEFRRSKGLGRPPYRILEEVLEAIIPTVGL